MRRLLGVLLTLCLVMSTVAAWAYWTAGSVTGGNGAAAVTSVSQGATPTASAAGNAVTVNWAATTLTIGTAVTGYTVKRYSGSTAQTILTACTGTVTATSCVESNVPTGVWTYSVTPVFATNWVGFESAKSNSVVVGNVAPTAVADSYSVAENAVLTVAASGVLGNDSDPNSDPLTAVLASGVANGAVSLSANGGFTYTPNPNFNGTDSFTYKANDGTQNSNVVTVTLIVTGVNDAPVNSVPGPQQTPLNTNRVFSAANNNPISISDVDAGVATVQVRLTATNGTVTLPVTTGLTFSVGNGTSAATMTFTGTIANINLRLNGAYFTPTGTFTAATLQIVTSDLGSTGTGGTLTDSDTIAITVNSLGIFTANQDIGAAGDPNTSGTSTYSGGTGYTVKGGGSNIWNNVDHFQYLYRDLPGDGRLTARVSSSTQTPLPVNAGAKAGVMFRESTAVGSKHAMMDLMQTAGTEFMFRATTDGSTATSGASAAVLAPYWIRITRVGNVITAEYSQYGVSWTIAGTAQTVVMNTSIKVGLAVTAQDNTKLNIVTYDNVAITTPPTAFADAYTTNENTTLVVPGSGVLANDTDPESDALKAVLVSGPASGTLTLNANGDGGFTYVPAANVSGTTSFTYKSNDGVFDSNTVTVTLTVNPANGVPSFTKGANQSVSRIVGAQAVAGWATAISQGTGDSGQLIDFVVTNTNNPLFSVQPAVSAAGTLTYTPAGTTGVATVSVNIHDNGGTTNGGSDTSAVQTFTITVTGYSSAVSGDSGLVSYWRLGEALATSPMDDITATNNNGTYGTPTMGVAGAIAGDSDTAVQFSGVSPAYATAARQLGGDFSFEFWFKSTQNYGSTCTQWWQGAGLIDAEVSGAANDFGISLCAGKVIAGVGSPDVSIVSPATYNNGAWHQVVFTRTQSTGAMALYVDGAAAGTTTGSVNALTSQPTLNFGRIATGGQYFAGSMDEVSLYNTVLSAATVTNHRQLGSSDFTGPTGGSVDASGLVGTGSRYAASTALSLVLAMGTDPSGMAATGNLLKRATATLTSGGTADGTCGAFGSYTTVTGGTDPVSPKSDTVSDQACYSYQYVVLDTQGNSTTYASPAIKVDRSPPAAPSLVFSGFNNTYWVSGATVFYRSAAPGSFVATAAAIDTGSGILSYAFPTLGTNWTSTPGALGVNTYSWSGAPAAPGTKNVTATNNATGVSGSTSFTPTVDNTAPSAGSVTPPNTTQASTSVSVGFTTGTDGGSGVGTRLLQRQSAPLTATCGTYVGGWTTVATNPASTSFTDDTVTGGFCYMYQYVVADNVGNTNTATSGNVVQVTAGSSTVTAQYKSMDASPTDNSIKPGLQLVNTGSSAVDLSTITVRYWFTKDLGPATFQSPCYWATIGCSYVNPSVVVISPRTGADAYLLVGFQPSTTLAVGIPSEIQIGINKTDWSNFSKADDYSYGIGTTYAESTKVTVYQNGILIWGTEPV